MKPYSQYALRQQAQRDSERATKRFVLLSALAIGVLFLIKYVTIGPD